MGLGGTFVVDAIDGSLFRLSGIKNLNFWWKNGNFIPMNRFSDRLAELTRLNLFGLCTYLATKLGLGVDKVRKYFIYASFATLGSSLLVYLVLTFFMELRRLTRKRSVWDL